MGLTYESFHCQFARNCKLRPRMTPEVQLKYVFFFSLFLNIFVVVICLFKTANSPKPREQKTVCVRRTDLCELIWSLVNSTSPKRVNTYPCSLDSGSISAVMTGLTLCAFGRHARLFSRTEFLLFVQLMSLNQCSHLPTKSMVNKFIFKIQLLQNALTSDCLACAESPWPSD